MSFIHSVQARQILDSRGNPTVEVDVWLDDGARGRALVPSGASTGKAEAVELRDDAPQLFQGRGVLQAVDNAQQTLSRFVLGIDARDQARVDQRLVEADGTGDRSRLGANAMLGVSMAAARAASRSAGLPLYRYLGGARAATLPVPMGNILSGGLHTDGMLDFQDYQMIPLRARSFAEALCDVAEVYCAMKDVLQSNGYFVPGVADEGGYAPQLPANETGFEMMIQAFERAGLKPGRDAAIAVDVAATHFQEGRHYRLSTEKTSLSSSEMADRLERWQSQYPIISIEDGLGEEDWKGWKNLTGRLSNRCQLLGDDLFVTNYKRLRRGIKEGIANAVLIKMNQAGTLTETLETLELARRHGYRTGVSARSGETEDDFMADLAVATGAGQIKIGAITRSERLAKYNRLLRIEESLGARAHYPGAALFGEGKSN